MAGYTQQYVVLIFSQTFYWNTTQANTLLHACDITSTMPILLKYFVPLHIRPS